MEFKNYELTHHGILGQKWGNQNGPPYPLDENDHSAREEKAGWKKSLDKASKSYKKESEKAARQIARNESKRYVQAYNKTADYMNNGGIAKYNSEHNVSDDDYESGYKKLFNSLLKQNYAKLQLSEFENNKHYKKAQSIVEEFGLEKYDSLVKDNIKAINELQEYAKGNNPYDTVSDRLKITK